jgi:glycine/D-amino acid oxidase-like deaminating enzyme
VATSNDSADIVIVGGGSAGAVLAARLSEDANRFNLSCRYRGQPVRRVPGLDSVRCGDGLASSAAASGTVSASGSADPIRHELGRAAELVDPIQPGKIWRPGL